VGLASAAMVLLLPAGVAPAAPGNGTGAQSSTGGGNDGHIQVDGLPLDPGMDNDPHVSCPFAVEFFGFDPTQLATITIITWAPTTTTPAGTLVYDGIPVTEHGSTPPPGQTFPGVGSTLDGWFEVPAADLAGLLSGIAPNPNQGYHVKLDVDLTGTPNLQGNDKYHTIWVAPCGTTTWSGESTATTTTTTLVPGVGNGGRSGNIPPVGGSGGNGAPGTQVGGSGGNGAPVTLAARGATASSGAGASSGTGGPVVSATTVHTGMPWAGSRPIELGGFGAGLAMVAWGLELRRRGKRALVTR
jgi:hypothetical protein